MDTDTNVDPRPQATAPSSTNRTEHRSKLDAITWLLFGIFGSFGGVGLAILWTTPSVTASTDDYAGLLYVVTVPLGFIIGTIVAMLIARSVERNSPSGDDLFTRTQLTFMGMVLPFLLWLAAAFAYGAIVDILG